MEPRPLSKPQRQPTTPPTTPAPSVDRGNWTPPQAKTSAGFSAPIIPPAPAYPGPATDPAAARSAWFDPAAAPAGMAAMPPVDGGYSPGPALKPIDGGKGARIIGPLLALIVLAAVVGAVVFVILRVFGGDDGRDGNTIAATSATSTAVAAAAGSPKATEASAANPTATGGGDAVAGAEETAGPKATKAADGETPEAKATSAPKKATAAPSDVVTARSMLPSSSELPDGFTRTDDDKRTKDEVAQSFPNAEEALSDLNTWDWRENAYRTFEIPAGPDQDPNGTTYINISIHRFGSKKGASNALTYFADSVKESQGLTEIEVDKIGDRTVALSGNPDGTANLVVLYIRKGNFLIRIGGSSPSGDPTQDVIDLANKIVDS